MSFGIALRNGVALGLGTVPSLSSGGWRNGPFAQSGPTLDLIFSDPASSGSVSNNLSINLDFTAQTYQVAAQYMVWE
jgi:hypothetical protein